MSLGNLSGRARIPGNSQTFPCIQGRIHAAWRNRPSSQVFSNLSSPALKQRPVFATNDKVIPILRLFFQNLPPSQRA